MKIKWGMMMTDGRGKLGGQVASKNRAGAYVRTKVTPSNPQTQAQSLVRQIFGVISKKWAGLTEIQRQAWNENANEGAFDKTDQFGDTKRPSGFNLYHSMNQLQALTSGELLQIPPSKALFGVVRESGITVSEGDPTAVMSINFNVSGEYEQGSYMQIQATAPVSAGKKYVKNLYRDVAQVVIEGGTQVIDLLPDYEAKFGAINGNEGRRISVRFRQVVLGQASSWVSVAALVEPATP